MIEARWLYDYSSPDWNPNLYVKNALGDVKEEVASELICNEGNTCMTSMTTINHQQPQILSSSTVTLTINEMALQQEQGTFYVWEIRKVVGTFWEKLEVSQFFSILLSYSIYIVRFVLIIFVPFIS